MERKSRAQEDIDQVGRPSYERLRLCAERIPILFPHHAKSTCRYIMDGLFVIRLLDSFRSGPPTL